MVPPAVLPARTRRKLPTGGGIGYTAFLPTFLSPSRSMATYRQAEVDAKIKALAFTKNTYQIERDPSRGKVLLDLYPDVAPGHCKNMIALSQIGFYDNKIFHRIIKDFMIQGGCPDGNGMGGPGYTINAEFNKTPHVKGVLSMARSQNPNSAGSQFFICTGDPRFLDGQYTAFGKTADQASLDNVLKMGVVPTGSDDRPQTPVKINKATVVITPK
ncbi:MAG: peptidylprolyl isomerase [Planctomycetaceae bacterium]